MIIIYLSGPVTGQVEHSKKTFFECEVKLKAKGFHVVNPHRVCEGLPPEAWAECMRLCFIELFKHKPSELVVAMIGNWQNSEGASLERMLASKLNYRVVLIEELINE